MFTKKKLFDNNHNSKNVHTLERLKHLYNVITKNTIVTEQNKDLLIEVLRAITELLIYGDQNDPTLFDYFLEKNMLSYFISIAKQDVNGSECLSVQLLQTLNILFENIKHETSLYYLLSNNHINILIQQKFDFTKEEITAYYISFLKTLSFKLNQHTIHFFINEHLDEFPLYTEAIKFFDNPEPMVRIAVQTITLNIFSIQDSNASQHVAKYSGPYFQSLAYSLEKNIIKLQNSLIEFRESVKEESQNLLIYKKNYNLENDKTYGGSVDNINKTSSNSQLSVGEKIRSSLSSPSASPKLNLSHNFGDIHKLKKSLLILESFEETVRQHINKLQYLDDVMSCKSYGLPLSLTLGETLINNVFVPIYLLPFITYSSRKHSNMDKHEIMGCHNLPIDLAIFLLIQCFASFPLYKPNSVNEMGRNYVIQQLSHILFQEKNPSQSILHRLGMRPKSIFAQHRTSDSMPDIDEIYIDRKIYENIRPNDPISQRYLLSDEFNQTIAQIEDPQREKSSSIDPDISKIYLVLLYTLKMDEVSNGGIAYQRDYLPLLTLTLISKILSNTPEAFIAPSAEYSSCEPLTTNMDRSKIEFPYVMPPNLAILVYRCLDFIEACSKSDLERIRMYTLYVALVLFIDIIDLVSNHIKNAEAIYESSILEKMYLESSPHPVFFTYRVLSNAFTRLNSLYSLKLESIINRFKMDDNMFLDLFENQYTLLSTLKIGPERGNLNLDFSSPLLLLNLNLLSDENLHSHVYKILLTSIMNHSNTKSSSPNLSVFLYRHLNGIVERVKAEITIFLLLRQVLDVLTNYLILLSQLKPSLVRGGGFNEIQAGDLLDPHLAYDRFYKDYSSSCLLPKIGDVIDLSTKDIISCSVEKHLSQGMPYWFLVVGAYDFALVVPHHKKMAHGIIKYVGPLKDIEVAGVTNDSCSLYVRVHRLFNGEEHELLGSGNKKSKHPDHQGSFHTLFKAKLSFEDVIRCQAAKNCLLKGRVKCRRSKSRILGKMLYAADPIYLPSQFKSFLSSSSSCNIVPSTSIDNTLNTNNTQLHSTTVDSIPRLENIDAPEEGKACSSFKLFSNTDKKVNNGDSIPLQHFTHSNISKSPPKALPSLQNYPLASQKMIQESLVGDSAEALEIKDAFHNVKMPKRFMPTVPGSARQQPNSSVYSPSAIRKMTTNLTGRPPSLQKCNAGYSTERLVRSLENHSDDDADDLYCAQDSSPTQAKRPLSHVRNKPNTFLDHILSRSNSHGSSIDSTLKETPLETVLDAKNETLYSNYTSKGNIKDL